MGWEKDQIIRDEKKYFPHFSIHSFPFSTYHHLDFSTNHFAHSFILSLF